MRNIHKYIIYFCLIIINISWIGAQEKSLTEIYRTGKVKFLEEFVISDEALPEGGYFGSITSLAVDDRGFIYICDYDSNNIKKFSQKGEFVEYIGKEGQGPGDLSQPLKISIVHDRLVVWDAGNMRISLFALDGTFIKSVVRSKNIMKIGSPYEIKALPGKKMVFETRVSYRRGPSRPWECYLCLFSFDVQHLKDIYQKDFWTRKNITKPRRASIPIPFAARVYWDVSPNGKIIIGFSDKYEIEIHDPEKGKISSFTHEYEPIKVNEEDRKQYFAGMVFSTSRGGVITTKEGAPDYFVKNTEFPRHKPVYNDIICDSEGNIWVHTFRRDKKEEDFSFDVFDENGKFINRMTIEGNRAYPRKARFKDRSFYIRETDKDGYQKVVVYRITG